MRTRTHILAHAHIQQCSGSSQHVRLTNVVHVQVAHTDAQLHAKNATTHCLVVVVVSLHLEALCQYTVDCLHSLKLGAGPESQESITSKLDNIPLSCYDGCKWRRVV